MAYEQKPNTGSLFKNERKTQDTHADYNGSQLICCPKCEKVSAYYQDAWINTDKNGKKYMSQKLKPKEGQPSAVPAKRKVGGMSDAALDDDMGGDSIPF